MIRLPWFLRLLWDPPTELDLVDRRGAIDHGKVIGFVTFVLMYVLIWFGLLPSIGHTIALLSAGFGWASWRTFLASKAVTSTEVVTRQVKEVVARRAVDEDGVVTEPAP
jgi:hypothetical protein